jgi:hypothetical protein
MGTENHKLHQKEIAHRRTGNGAELGDDNITGERGKANGHYEHRNDPVVEDHNPVGEELLEVIATPASEYPEFIRQIMATNCDKIGNRYRDQRWEDATKKRHPAAVDNGNAGSYGHKTHESENPIPIQKVLKVHLACSIAETLPLCKWQAASGQNAGTKGDPLSANETVCLTRRIKIVLVLPPESCCGARLASSFAKRATCGARLTCEADIEGRVRVEGCGYGGQVARPTLSGVHDRALATADKLCSCSNVVAAEKAGQPN